MCVRFFDYEGRIMIPKTLCIELGIDVDTPVEIIRKDDGIFLNPAFSADENKRKEDVKMSDVKMNDVKINFDEVAEFILENWDDINNLLTALDELGASEESKIKTISDILKRNT